MNHYKFPVINCLDDVRAAIEPYDEFRIMEKDWYTVVNYVVSKEETFLPIENSPGEDYSAWLRRECRGLIFDEYGQLISRPYHKFFNVGEKAETQSNKIDLTQPHVILEKLDGSMIRPIPYYGKDFRLATKAGITDVAMNAEVFIADKPEYTQFIEECIRINTTPIFEWCSRKNRIVIDYPEDKLILTAIRANDHGEYIRYTTMKNLAESYTIPVVRAINAVNVHDINEFINQIREWEDSEGIVGRFDDGHMFKIKADDYVLRHRSKDAINQEKNVIATIVNDEVDDLIPLLTPEDATLIQEFQKSFWEGVDELARQADQMYAAGISMYPTQKDFATEYVQKYIRKKYATIMYGMRAGKSAKDMIIAMIQKSLSTQTKINESRWLWGDQKWN